LNSIMGHIEFIQIFISACSGFFGVGIGIGVFRSTIRQIKTDLAEVIKNQKALRSGHGGGFPIYMSRITCDEIRRSCEKDREDKAVRVITEITTHAKTIKALENYARWEMQNKGLKIEEVNQILIG